MGKAYDIKKGKQYFTFLTGALMLVTVGNSIFEVVSGTSYGVLVIQLVFLLALIGLPLALMRGYKRKGLFFGILLLAGIFGFYQAGARMPDISQRDITLPPIFTICIGLGYLISAIYLSYSPEIDQYLKQKQAERQKMIEQSY